MIGLNNLKRNNMTAVEWLTEKLRTEFGFAFSNNILEEAKEMEQTNTDNKVIHFAEWLTKKHTLALIILYEQFEEQEYGDK
jgi:hypothetical protein